VTFCLEGHWRKCRYLVISDKKIIPRNRRKKWLFLTEFQLFRGTENLWIPFRTLPGKRKQLGIPFRETKIEANSHNSVPNPNPLNQKRRKLSEFRSIPKLWIEKTNVLVDIETEISRNLKGLGAIEIANAVRKKSLAGVETEIWFFETQPRREREPDR
jgi:hypothetical protein